MTERKYATVPGCNLAVEVLFGNVKLLVDELHLEVHLPLIGQGQNEMGQHQTADHEHRRRQQIRAHQPLERTPPARTAMISLRCANRLVNSRMVRKTMKALSMLPKARQKAT